MPAQRLGATDAGIRAPKTVSDVTAVRLIILLLTVLLLLSAGWDVLGISGPLAPFVAQIGSGRALLAVRGGLLAAATWPLAHAPNARAMKAFGGVACLFVASVAAEGLLLPFVFVSLAVTLWSPLPPLPWPPRAQKGVLALAGVSVACFALGLGFAALRDRSVEAPPAATDPATEAARWTARENVYRARYWARVAAEQTGGHDGALPRP